MEKVKAPEVSIVIPTTLRKMLIENLTDVIEKVSFQNTIFNTIFYEVILVIDGIIQEIPGETQKILNEITLKYPFFSYYQNSKKGAAANRNYGAIKAKGKYLLFFDDDLILPSIDVIQEMYNFVSVHPHTAINPNWILPPALIEEMKKTKFGRFIINVDLINYRGWVNLPEWDDKNIFEASKISVYCLMISKEDFDNSKGFDEIFGNQGSEDFELSRRLRENNVKLYINPLLCIYHNEYDRMDIRGRMQRLYNGAKNRKVAYQKLGIEEFNIRYHPIKKAILSVISNFPNFWLFIYDLVPNYKIFDFFSFKLAHVITAIYIYLGFCKSKIE